MSKGSLCHVVKPYIVLYLLVYALFFNIEEKASATNGAEVLNIIALGHKTETHQITSSFCRTVKLQYVQQEQAVDCEFALVVLDTVVIKANEIQDKDAQIIIISRLGKNERNKRLNTTRLSFAEKHLEDNGYKAYVTAIGKRTAGLGRLEIYLNGKLFESLPIKRNLRHFCADSYGL